MRACVWPHEVLELRVRVMRILRDVAEIARKLACGLWAVALAFLALMGIGLLYLLDKIKERGRGH